MGVRPCTGCIVVLESFSNFSGNAKGKAEPPSNGGAIKGSWSCEFNETQGLSYPFTRLVYGQRVALFPASLPQGAGLF